MNKVVVGGMGGYENLPVKEAPWKKPGGRGGKGCVAGKVCAGSELDCMVVS